MKMLILNGPNLNLLGCREPEIYGALTLEQIQKKTEAYLKQGHPNLELEWLQSNSEGQLIDSIQKLQKSSHAALLINPGGYSHTSVSILDALKIVKVPVIEVHLSNIFKREEFRQTLLTAQAARVVISGAGEWAYILAIQAALLMQPSK